MATTQQTEKTDGVHLEFENSPAQETAPLDKIDTVHNDEGIAIIANYDGEQTWTPEEEKKLVRKIDRRVLPILFVTFALQFYDKYMLSHAAIFGLRTDLDLTVGNRYAMTAAIFYLGYMAGAYPMTLLAQRFRINHVIFATVLIWGLCVLSTAGCTTYRGIYTQRFFLGILESGIPPTFMVVVGSWYTKAEQTFRQGIWFSAAGLVAVPAPLVNYGLGHIKGALGPWQYMYIFAGSITTLWAVPIFFFMEPDPVHAKSLSEREKFIAISRIKVNNTGVRNTHFKTKQLGEILMSLKFWLLAGMGLCITAISTISTVFLPILIAGMGFSGFNALLLSVPVGVVSTFLCIVTTWTCRVLSKYNPRTWGIFVCGVCMLLTAAIMWKVPHAPIGAKLFLLYLIQCFPGCYALIMDLSIANTAGYTKRTLMSAGLYFGYCVGNFVTPFTFLVEEGPTYPTGFTYITAVISLFLVLVLVLAYRFVCVRENKRRDAAGFVESFDHAYEDDATDKTNMNFRYVY
ncbi:uncharacterized protein Z520_00761 [Fonsecaea multimorphosa CBS 102226]|uniref:Major facilitator superfamily (MFS) profile domain-containing protein n=1 Tax=Fonsecaea multimorphosa CBS 102226 TaxID=1442371 RepID=A0A0D2L4T1_9EURO|nr:uncharacterized protein Z520_00761 [Fonsecaea multimorphosa CBS 102226]KIY04069.1 hypothetical protein Z520_00761 [Fonsecaea multimorphosa CBS 102226]OAL31904.1 hypothetical protein AYO22_00774 [Fonsecaea multimorphosa]